MSALDFERRILDGSRLTPDEGLRLLTDDIPVPALGAWAHRARCARHGPQRVTYVIDSNPNYTNICRTGCAFCAFARRPQDPDAWVLTVDQVMERVARAVQQGATTILLQGGHNPDLPLSYYLSLVRETRSRFPGVTPHFFSASEIDTMAAVSGQSVPQVLQALWDAGQRTLPGGGAEVLSRRVRMRVSPKKGGPERWLNTHRAAHRIGFKSTATLMYGHVETAHDIVEHWENVRSLQDETGGFTAFIPWSFKPTHTPLETRVSHPAGPVSYLRILAGSRLYLDNVSHVQASWFSEGKRTGQTALWFGADDFGGTLLDENVHAAAGHVNQAGPDDVRRLIEEAGFVPAQRTTDYTIL